MSPDELKALRKDLACTAKELARAGVGSSTVVRKQATAASTAILQSVKCLMRGLPSRMRSDGCLLESSTHRRYQARNVRDLSRRIDACATLHVIVLTTLA